MHQGTQARAHSGASSRPHLHTWARAGSLLSETRAILLRAPPPYHASPFISASPQRHITSEHGTREGLKAPSSRLLGGGGGGIVLLYVIAQGVPPQFHISFGLLQPIPRLITSEANQATQEFKTASSISTSLQHVGHRRRSKCKVNIPQVLLLIGPHVTEAPSTHGCVQCQPPYNLLIPESEHQCPGSP